MKCDFCKNEAKWLFYVLQICTHHRRLMEFSKFIELEK